MKEVLVVVIVMVMVMVVAMVMEMLMRMVLMTAMVVPVMVIVVFFLTWIYFASRSGGDVSGAQEGTMSRMTLMKVAASLCESVAVPVLVRQCYVR